MQNNVSQAVILSGGLGKRLMPLTKDVPKPMVAVNGKPFLEYLILQLRQQGFKRVLLLTGYLQEKIEDYFGDGSRFGVEITYSHGDTEWETGRRLYRARHLLDEHFFLLYGDNFYNFNINALKGFFEANTFPLTLVVTPKSSGNIALDKNGKILTYDSTRQGAQLTHVELGYMIMHRSVIEMVNDGDNPSFSQVIAALAKAGKLGGFHAHDIYHSISDPARLKLLEHYLTPKKLLLIDRDGTLNVKAPRGRYITSAADFNLLPESVTALQELATQGYRFIVITNQAGLATGDLTVAQLESIHLKMRSELNRVGIVIEGIYVSDAHWQDTGNWNRKPNPGMFFQLAKDFQLYLRDTVYIGDDLRDMEAAQNANTNGIYFGNLGDVSGTTLTSVAFASPQMSEVVDFVLKKFGK